MATDEPRPSRKPEDEPPGEFLSDDLKHQTQRFLDEVKRQIKRRRHGAGGPKLGPPQRRKP